MDLVKVCFCSIDKDWDREVLNHNVDIYHLSGWVEAAKKIDKGESRGIVATYHDKKVFFPVLIRNLEDGVWDVTSTYGYGGPIVDPKLSHEEITKVMQEVVEFLYQQGCVSWFIRLHPILNQSWSAKVGTIIEHGPTLVSDLTKSEEEHWRETQRQHRQGIKKAIKKGVTVKIESMQPRHVPTFKAIYTETMRTVKASQYYYFEEDYFYALCENIPDRLLIAIAYLDGAAISSTIFTVCKESKIIQFHLSGTLNSYRNLQPSKLITHEIRTWGREAKYECMHLGGGVGAKCDTLYNFKKGFSSSELMFKTQRIVVNAEKYQQLAEQADNTENEDDFFPIYRQRH